MLAQNPKTNAGLRSRWASTRDLPTIAFIRAGVLLRRNGPVTKAFSQRTGPGAIMDKSERPFMLLVSGTPQPPPDCPIFTYNNNPGTCNLQSQSVTYVLNQKCYLCSDHALGTRNPELPTRNPEPLTRSPRFYLLPNSITGMLSAA